MDLPNLDTGENTDKGLWDAFRQGSKFAFEQIYRTNIQELYSYGMKIHHNSSLVKDVIQTLFVELWQSRTNLSATSNIKYYLFKAIRIKIYRVLKSESHHRQKEKKNNFSDKIEASYESQLIEAEFQQECRRKLYKALKELPHRQKEVIHLLFTEELSYEQIAELMAINVASVYTLAWKALSSLKQLLVLIISFVFYYF